MADENNEPCQSDEFVSSTIQLRKALAALLRADEFAAKAGVRQFNKVALDMLVHHVMKLSKISAEHYVEAFRSGDLIDMVTDLASTTQALTSVGTQRLQ